LRYHALTAEELRLAGSSCFTQATSLGVVMSHVFPWWSGQWLHHCSEREGYR
jgi:hypothetical protein